MTTHTPLTTYAPPGHTPSTHEDAHVHTSRCNDATETLADIAGWAQPLTWLALTTHIRVDTPADDIATWAATTGPAWSDLSPVPALVSVETKLLDTNGTLDAPDGLLTDLRASGDLDTLHIADHQHPTPDGPLTPSQVRELLYTRAVTAETLTQWLTDAYVNSMTAHPGSILAHPCSITDKTGITSSFTTEQLERIATTAAAHNCAIELNNKWDAPNIYLYLAALKAGTPVVNATDAHHIGDHNRRHHLHLLTSTVNTNHNITMA